MRSDFYNFTLEVPKKIPIAMEHLAKNRPTFIHGDSWINNWMFDNQIPVLIDWQTCCYGNGVYDLATMLSSCLCVWSKEIQHTILNFYLTVLGNYGCRNYTYEMLENDFKQAKIFTFAVTFPVLRHYFVFDADEEELADYHRKKNFYYEFYSDVL